jgi:hypothetical protein
MNLRYTPEQVFAAAAAAHRINDGEYVKQGSTVADPDNGPYALKPNPKTPNSQLMLVILDDGPPPTDEDVEMANIMLTHFRGLTIKLLSGKKLSDYERRALESATAPSIQWSDLGIIASLPSSWIRDKRNIEIKERISGSNRGWVGIPGERLVLNVEILRCFWSYNWKTWYVTALTEDNHSVFFSIGRELQAGSKIRISGTVKSHQPTFETKLNRVRVEISADCKV